MENEKDQTQYVENQMTKCLLRLKNEGAIPEGIFNRLKPIGSIIPRLYGLPKIHKPNTPMRPILDMSNSPYQSTAQWLVEILEPIRQQLCPYSLGDSFEFVEQIKEFNADKKIMGSFDVTSLFTNVPLLDTINLVCDYVKASDIQLPITTAALKELLLRCTFNVQFLFNGTFFRQTDGIAMGSSLGCILSDIFMGSLESRQLKETIRGTHFYRRYVDDIFIVVDKKTELHEALEIFNSAHPSMKFTSEIELNNSFHFLDVQLTRKPDGSLMRSVYRKPTWTGQYTNFNSFVPMKQKRMLVHTLLNRAKRICSEDTINRELEHIANVLRQNGFPDRFISRNMTPRTGHPQVLTVDRKRIFLNLPFKGDIAADLVNRRLYSSLRRTFSTATLRSWFSTTPLLRLSLKDKVPVHSQNMIVYSFSCCCAAEYIGRTTRQLAKRVKEHHPAWLQTGNRKTITSAIVGHLADTGHKVNPSQAFRVIYKAPRNLPKSIQKGHIAAAEAVAIRLRIPILCCQKRFVQTLHLPWPTNTRPLTHPNAARVTQSGMISHYNDSSSGLDPCFTD
jgi:hypothetical protein